MTHYNSKSEIPHLNKALRDVLDGVRRGALEVDKQGRVWEIGEYDENTGTVIPCKRARHEKPALEIRHRRSEGESLKDLAAEFGLDPSVVSRICRGEIHKDAGGPLSKFEEGHRSKKKPSRKKRVRQFFQQPLEPEEADALYSACDDETDRLIVGVLLGTGLRLAEFHSLTVKSILHQQDRIRVYGKGGKWRTAPLVDQRARALLISWFAVHETIGIGKRAIQARLKRIAKRAGIKKKVSPHVLRHTFARTAVDRDVSTSALQQALGHKSLNTTQLYIYMDNNRVIDEFSNKWDA